MFYARSTLEFNHMLIDALFTFVRQDLRKFSIEIFNQYTYFECMVILRVVSETKVLENLDKTVSNYGVLNFRISNKRINSPLLGYTW